MAETRALVTFAVFFTRTEKQGRRNSELGLFIGRHDGDASGFIVDMNGERVKEIWDYKDAPYLGCLHLQE